MDLACIYAAPPATANTHGSVCRIITIFQSQANKLRVCAAFRSVFPSNSFFSFCLSMMDSADNNYIHRGTAFVWLKWIPDLTGTHVAHEPLVAQLTATHMKLKKRKLIQTRARTGYTHSPARRSVIDLCWCDEPLYLFVIYFAICDCIRRPTNGLCNVGIVHVLLIINTNDRFLHNVCCAQLHNTVYIVFACVRVCGSRRRRKILNVFYSQIVPQLLEMHLLIHIDFDSMCIRHDKWRSERGKDYVRQSKNVTKNCNNKKYVRISLHLFPFTNIERITINANRKNWEQNNNDHRQSTTTKLKAQIHWIPTNAPEIKRLKIINKLSLCNGLQRIRFLSFWSCIHTIIVCQNIYIVCWSIH